VTQEVIIGVVLSKGACRAPLSLSRGSKKQRALMPALR
jgi:hypothetical protein